MKMNDEKLNWIKWAIIVSNIINAGFALNMKLFSDASFDFFVQLIPLISILSIVVSDWYRGVYEKNNLRKLYENQIKSNKIYNKTTLKNIIEGLLNNDSSNSLSVKGIKTETHRRRIKKRDNLKIIAGVIIIAALPICFFWDYPYVYIFIICIVAVVMIYADFLLSVDEYAKKYDSRFVSGEKCSVSRGLARLYYEEYKKTGFDRTHKFYSDIENNIKDLECKKHIIRMALDQNNNIDIIFNLVLLFFNVMLIFPQTEKFVVAFWGKTNGGYVYEGSYIYITLATLAMNIYVFVKMQGTYDCMKMALMTYIEDKEEFNSMFKCCEANITKLIRCRGIFQYSIGRLDNGEKTEDIRWGDRMLFVHRMYTHIPRLKLTVILLAIGISSLLIPVFKTNIYLYALNVAVAIVIYFLLRNFYLPIAGKKQIIKWCTEFDTQSEIKTKNTQEKTLCQKKN